MNKYINDKIRILIHLRCGWRVALKREALISKRSYSYEISIFGVGFFQVNMNNYYYDIKS